MRWLTTKIVWLLIATCVSTGAAAQQPPPYEAVIKNSSTVVHSAPSKRAYATEVLDRGSRVDVYRHDPDGWCAIRPPQGSFSLVPRAALNLTADQTIGRIDGDGVKAWIGTRISHRGDALWQVKLSKGELVEILEVSPLGADAEADEWVLIAPPAGEFRWVHESDLARDRVPSNVSFPDAPSSSIQPPPREASSSIATDGTGAAATDTPRELPTRALEIPGGRNVSSDPGTVVPATVSTGDDFVRRDGSVAGQAGQQAAEVQAAATIDLSMSAVERLRLAEQTLSALLLHDASASSQQLRQLLTSLAAPETPAELGPAVQTLGNRFQRFEELELKRKAVSRLAESQPNLLSDTSLSQPLSDRPASGVTGPAGKGGQPFVVEGRLNRLVRAGGLQASGYAIQGPNGGIQAMVVAAPGVNLERHLKENVGIQGSQTAHPRWKIPVVLAERVIDLDRRR